MKYFRLSLLDSRKTERGAINRRSHSAERAAPFALRTSLLACFAAGLIGQTGRDAYRHAYDVWQQAQTNLERDAGTGGAPQVAQADRSAAAAASFEATRIAYLKSSGQEAAQRRQILQTPATRTSPDLTPPAVANLAAAELQTVTRAIAKFATDKDPGIQQLRQSMERERIALAALTDTIRARQKTVAATLEAASALDQARAKTAAAFADQASQFSQTVSQMEMEGAAWANYYDKLAEAIQTASAPAPPPVNITTNVTTSASPAAPRNASASPVPLVRYVGDWTYPKANGIFHGAQPESVELEVNEKDGHVDGTLEARFKVSPGGANDPVVQFKFAGDVAATPTQKFTLMTSDGTPGFLELIPGPAFNLLEVNFQADPRANKLRAGNFILVKK
jgi:hypothetical protein